MNQLRVVRRGRAVRLIAPEGTFSYYHPDRLFTGYAWDAQTASVLLAGRHVSSVLLLGLGGGTVARQCRALVQDAEIVAVEVDPWVVRVARQFFCLDSLNVSVSVGPAARFLATGARRFDVILDDLWPPQPDRQKPLVTSDNWAPLVATRLESDGVYAASLYCRRDRPAAFKRSARALADTFGQVQEVRPALGQVTVLAAGTRLTPPGQVLGQLRSLPQRLAVGLAHVSIRWVLCHR